MKITKFVDKLPVLKTLRSKSRIDGITYYEVSMRQFKQKLHRDIPATLVWGFQNNYPGPTIEAQYNEPIKIKWLNNLPKKHLLPVDTTVHGAEPMNPRVRTVIHLHGGVVPPESDGYPEAWFTSGYQTRGPFFTTKIYDYPNQQRPSLLWYHAHAIGITRLNVYAGLAGAYIIRDPMERFLNLPVGRFEIPLLIQDRSFHPDGSLFYPSQPNPPVPGVNPSVIPDFFGETILVNGKVWPYLDVEPRRYRFRIINGSNARFYKMKLSTRQPFYQIGIDGGLLETPIITPEILLAPAERADLIIDFSDYWKQNILLTNDAVSPYPRGAPVNSQTTGQIMQFRVSKPLSNVDNSVIPAFLSKITWLEESQAQVIRNLTLERKTDRYGRPFLLLDGKRWDDPISEKPKLQDIEVWNLINIANSTHPIHLHLVNFQILSRQQFDVEYYQKTKQVLTTGSKMPPELNERGWKDTVRANPGQITSLITQFGPYTGRYVWHCHILEHEDHEMMRPYEVIF